jgi:hypothetical protein
MMIQSWWKKLIRRTRQEVPPAHRGGRRQFRPRLEVLEERTLLSVYFVDRLGDAGAGAGPAGDLRYCLNQATANGDVIQFNVAGTVQLNGELPTIANDLTILGNEAAGVTLQRGGFFGFRILTVAPGATVAVSNLTIAGGFAADAGGGIYNAGTLTLSNSTVTDNFSLGAGAGVFNAGTLTLVNSTVHGNAAAQGAGVYNAGILNVVSSTIAGNTANNQGGGLYNAGALAIRNTIVAQNLGYGGGADVYGFLDSGGHNLIGSSAGGQGYQPTDLLDVDPLLGPLRDNGGPTPTRALLPGSPAIDAGDGAGAPATDQRGRSRISGAALDIGAFELQSLVVTSTADSGPGSLRDAIAEANRSGGNVIVIAAGGVLSLASPLPVITGSLEIRGPGSGALTLRRDSAEPFSLFTVATGASVSLSGLTLAEGGGVESGAGVYNGGGLVLSDIVITGGSAAFGGGIANFGTLTLVNSTVANSRAELAGGGILNVGTLILINSTVAGSSASAGGGISNSGMLTLINSTVTGNGADYVGGGIYNIRALVLDETSVVAGNTAPEGPDIYSL